VAAKFAREKSAPAASAPIPSYGPPLFKADAANLAFAADMEGGNGAASLGEARDLSADVEYRIVARR
jgi:hypothetical protein